VSGGVDVTLGVQVPGDVSVVGFDNVLLADVVDPALTTVPAPVRKAGAAGVGNVLAPAAGARSRGENLVLPVKRVVRESTAPPGPRPRTDQPSRNSISPARGTTSVSGSASNAATSTDAGSR
jgi:hypothetical protein